MAWYKSGTLTFTEGSTAVVGVGTNFVANALTGAGIVIDGATYGVESVQDATHLTLVDPWPNPSATSVVFSAFPTSSFAQDILNSQMELIDSFGPFRGATADFKAIISDRADQVASDHADVVIKHAEVLSATSAASTSQLAAAVSETNSRNSELAAAASRDAAATSEANASASAGSAADSEAHAATSEANAATSESAAAQSEQNAADSEATAIAQAAIAVAAANDALASAQAGATSEQHAADSAAAANLSKIAAQAARDATLEAFADFDQRYMGEFPSDPTDDAGGPIAAGKLYFNTTATEMRLYTGSRWAVTYVQGDATYLQLVGGELTGPLKLPGNPTDPKHAATKQYVDDRSGVTKVAGKTGEVSLLKADVGLANVDNTSDAGKPVSTAQAAAIAGVATGAATDLANAVSAIAAAAANARRLSFFLNRR